MTLQRSIFHTSYFHDEVFFRVVYIKVLDTLTGVKLSIIDAILNLAENTDNTLGGYTYGNNRANNMGEALEEYTKDLFAGTSNELNATDRLRKHESVFSYLGNQNNPPDAMLRGDDAIEVKKIQRKTAELALNSSYPKNVLNADSSRITSACRNSENWTVKDIIYVVGYTSESKLSRLFFVYGRNYAATKETYTGVFDGVQRGIKDIPDFNFTESKELGRVPNVDPLGITYMRIRGMWHIKNPWTVFGDIYSPEDSFDFNFACIIDNEKWNQLVDADRLFKRAQIDDTLEIIDVAIKNPDNPAQLIDARLITIRR